MVYIIAPALAMIPALISASIAVVPVGAFPTCDACWVSRPADVPLQLADFNVGVLYLLAVTSIGVYGITHRRLGVEQQVLDAGRHPLGGAADLVRAGAGPVDPGRR